MTGVKQEIKSVGVMSVAKLFALLGLVIGIILALTSGAFGLLALAAGGDELGVGGIVFIGMAVAALIVMPIIYFIVGAIYAIIYNIAAKLVGGLELELVEKKK